MFPLNAITLRLFVKPIFLVLLSLIIYVALAYWIPREFQTSLIFKPLGDALQRFAGSASLIVLGYATLVGAIGYYRYWQWSNGETPSCPRCGMMMEVRNGRRGIFWGCAQYPACRGTEDY